MVILPQIRELQRADLTDQVGNGSTTLQTGAWRNISGSFSDISSDNTEVYCSNFNASVIIKSSTNSTYVSSPNPSNTISLKLGKSYYNSYNLNYLGSQSTYSVVSSICYVSTLHSFSIGDSVYIDFSSGGASSSSNFYSITENRKRITSSYSISSSNLGTVTTSSNHNLLAGDEFQITFDTGGGSIYNGTYRVRAVSSATSFTFLFPYLQQVSSYSGSSTVYLFNQELSFNLPITNTSGNCSYRIYVDTPVTLRKGIDGTHGQGGGGAGGQGSGGGGGGGGGGAMAQVFGFPIPPAGQSGYAGQGGTTGSGGGVGNLNGYGGGGGAGASLLNYDYRRGGYGGSANDGFILVGDGGYGGWEGVTPGGKDGTTGGGGFGGPGGTGYTGGGQGGAPGGGGGQGAWGFYPSKGGGGGGQGGAGSSGGGGNTASNGSSGVNPSKSLFLLINNRSIANTVTVQSNTADFPLNPTTGTEFGLSWTGGQGGQGGQGSTGNVSRILIFNRFETYNIISFSIPSQTSGSDGTSGYGGFGGGGGSGGGGGTGGPGGWVAIVGDQFIFPDGRPGGWGVSGSVGAGGYKGGGGIGGRALKFVPPSNKIFF